MSILDTDPLGAILGSNNLGSCLVASDVPFTGMAKDIFDRRVDGKSWKEIADEFDLGSPSKARTTFTKLTGITDYKIKGSDLLKLAKGGVDPSLAVPIAEKQAAKAAAKMKKTDEAIDAGKTGIVENPKSLADKPTYPSIPPGDSSIEEFVAWDKEVTQYYEDLDAWKAGKASPESVLKPYAPSAPPPAAVPKSGDIVLKKPEPEFLKEAKPSYQTVVDLNKEGKGYAAIVQQTGLPIQEVDKVIWNNLLEEFHGDIWKAYVKKPGSQEGFNSVKQMVFDLRKAGKTQNQIQLLTEIDEKVLKAIIEDKWKLPNPGTFQYYVPPEPPSYSYGGYGSGSAPTPKGKGQSNVGFRWDISDDFPTLTAKEMVDAHHSIHVAPEVKSALQSYTGSGYHTVNGFLRGHHNSSSTRDLVERIDRGMVPTTRPMTVSRGMDRSGFGLGNLSDADVSKLAGHTARDPGYMSTSIGEKFNKEIRFIIECPVGTKGHWVAGFSQVKSEEEYLLGRGTRIIIKEVIEEVGRYGGKAWIVYGRVIP